ncbi:MAG: LysR family transcriptional regulator [Oscillospiraceae bacterium]|nr:LysR family transcriptional regulator [Oscillospiraceae bacterium]
MFDFRMETFLKVCETLHYTKAAQQLGLTQPAVSQHIHFLEDAYGVKLFTYRAKKLTLTAAGELLREYALTRRHDDAFLREKLAGAAAGRKTLSFGATLTIAEFVLPKRLAAYLKEASPARLKLTVANTGRLLKQLDAGALDMALVEGYFSRQKYASLTYARERYIAVCAPQHPLSGRPAGLEELLPERLLLREKGSGTREILEKHLEACSLSIEDFAGVAEIGDIRTIKQLAMQNCGVCFLYEAAVRDELKAGLLKEIPLRGMSITHDFSFIWRKGSLYAQEYTAVFEALKNTP